MITSSVLRRHRDEKEECTIYAKNCETPLQCQSAQRHSRVTQDDGMVTLSTLRAATVLSRDCCADFGLPLSKKVMSHSRDGPVVTVPLRKNRCGIPLLSLPPFKNLRPKGHFLSQQSARFASTILTRKITKETLKRIFSVR